MKTLVVRWFVFLVVASSNAVIAATGVLPRLAAEPSQGTIRLSWSRSASNAVLETTSALGAGSQWQSLNQAAVPLSSNLTVSVPDSDPRRFFRLRAAVLTTIATTSPVDGEGDVSVNRETEVLFSAPLATNTMLTTTNFYAVYGGRRLLSRVELSSDRTTAWLFFLEPIPGSTRINVVFDGTDVRDATGQLIDADGDGVPGGIKAFSFQTLSNTALPNTAVIGTVFAAEPGSSGGGGAAGQTNVPLAGVIITVDGQEETLRAVTDAAGNFVLNPAPGGQFFVKIDGRTVPGTQYPNGPYYPFVGKEWEAIPGQTNNLAGGTGRIYLPLIPAGTLQAVSPTQPTVIGFAPSVLVTNATFAGVSITVPPNDLFSDSGVRGGKVGIAPVPPDRLPGPLPLGLEFPLVITIQTDGAENFDVPVPVRFPNLPDPVTGQLLPPGAKTALWSFNHRTGRWEIQGPATVSADGLYVDTDPGVGVRQPGWHGINPGTSGLCNGGWPCASPPPGGSPPPGAPPPPPGDPCQLERKKEWSASLQCGATGLLAIPQTIPLVGCAISVGQAIVGSAIDCSIDKTSCKSSVASQFLGAALGCLPFGGGLASLGKCMIDTASAHGDYANCMRANGLSSASAPSAQLLSLGDPSQIPHNVYNEQAALMQASADLLNACFGSSKWTESDPNQLQLWDGFMRALSDATLPGSVGGPHITPVEAQSLLALPLPSNLTSADAAALVTRMDAMGTGTLPDAQFDSAAISTAAAQLAAVAQELQNRGWETTYDGFVRGPSDLANTEAQIASQQPGFNARLYYRVIDLNTDFAQRGRLNTQGKFDTLVLAPNHFHLAEYVDPVSLWIGRTVFFSGANGTTSAIPLTTLEPPAALDTDADGLPDEVELVLGTNPNNAYTFGGSINDGAALKLGLNPLDGVVNQTGVTAALSTTADSVDIAVDGDLVALASGNQGLQLIVTQSGQNPVLLAQIPSDNHFFTRVALGGGQLCALDSMSGLLLYDLSDPAQPQLVKQVQIGPADGAVVMAADRAFVGVGNQIAVIRLPDGAVLNSQSYTFAKVKDLAVAGDYLYVLSDTQLHAISIADDLLKVVSLTNSPAPFRPNARLFAGGTMAYAVVGKGYNSFSLADPGHPALLTQGNSAEYGWKQMVDNGNGLGVAAVGPNSTDDGTHDVSLYDLSNPNSNEVFLTTFPMSTFLARTLVLDNGLAYVGGRNGLQILAYLALDGNGKPPSLKLDANFSLINLQAEAGTLARLTALATDDVQVRNVEFYLDGSLAATVGRFPFDFRFRVPWPSSSKTNLTLRAKAIDTGGNSTWSDVLTLRMVDTTPPYVTSVQPGTNAVLVSGTVSTIAAVFTEGLNPASVSASALELRSAGADKVFGTADDLLLDAASASYNVAQRQVLFQLPAPLDKGLYQATVRSNITDVAGIPLVPYTWNFEVRDPDTWALPTGGFWDVAANWAGAAVPQNYDVVLIQEPGQTITYRAVTTLLTRLTSTSSLDMTDGALTLADNSSISADFTLAGGTLTLPKTLSVQGQFKYTGGSLNGGGSVVTKGGLVLRPSNGALLVGPMTLENQGAGTWAPGSGILIQDRATLFINDPGATFEAQDGSVMAFTGGFGAPYPRFINSGTFVKDGATNTTYLNSVELDNDGLVDIKTGTLSLAGGAKGSGQFSVAAGATLDFTGPTNSLLSASSISGAGRVSFSNGASTLAGAYDVTGDTIVGLSSGFGFGSIPVTFGGPVHIAGSFDLLSPGQAFLSGSPVNIDCPVNISGGVLVVNSTSGPVTVSSITVAGGRLAGSSDVIVTGPVVFTNGAALSGPGRLIAQGGIEIQGSLSLAGGLFPTQSPGRIIDNASNCVLSTTSTVGIGVSNTFNNLPGALFDMQVDGFFGGGGAYGSVFNNAGTFRKSGGTGMGQISPLFNNSGTLDIQSGSFNVFNGLVQTSGQTLLYGTKLMAYPFLDFEGGVFVGTGTLDVAYLTNACQFSMGTSIGQLKATLYYVQTSKGSLSLRLGGSTPGTDYDQLAVQNQATLAGTLNLSLISGYSPKLGDTFQVLTCGSRQGTFTTVNGLNIGGGQKLVVTYSNTAVAVTVAAAP